MRRSVIAVSGGMDSCVLLDFLASSAVIATSSTTPVDAVKNTKTGVATPKLSLTNPVVAHCHHGTRPSADADADFVRRLAQKYGWPCVVKKVALGAGASEATARQARWQFLEGLADGGPIFTAHHLDDLVETVAINLVRGTGWRGLTPFQRANSVQPFLEQTPAWSRRDVARYAAEHHLTWRQDPTNFEDQYLRNRLRPRVAALSPEVKTLVLALFRRQCNTRGEVERLTATCVADLATPTREGVYLPRAPFAELAPDLAQELLRTALAQSGLSATRPQVAALCTALRDYAPGKKFNLAHDQLITIRQHDFLLPKT